MNNLLDRANETKLVVHQTFSLHPSVNHVQENTLGSRPDAKQPVRTQIQALQLENDQLAVPEITYFKSSALLLNR